MGIIDCALIAAVILAREGSFVVRVYGEGLGSKEGLRELVAGCRHDELKCVCFGWNADVEMNGVVWIKGM